MHLTNLHYLHNSHKSSNVCNYTGNCSCVSHTALCADILFLLQSMQVSMCPSLLAFCPLAGGNLHAMDCTDIIIIGARGRTHRIRDYYTRDRSMPREDEMYGGAYSLTSAVAVERAGKTTAIFRRKLNSNDVFPDYNITDTAMHVIWAIGQTPGDINHTPQSSLEANEASNRDFYQPDEIKYHGSVNRGATQINFFSKDSR